MNKPVTALITTITLLLASQSGLADNSQQSSDRRGPPPEAYSICEDKNAGDSVQLENRRGELMTGTCEDHDGKLALRPERKQSSNQQRRSPPPEAYTACEGKTAGDTAQFENRRGEMLTGRCEENNGKLVLRPDRPKR